MVVTTNATLIATYTGGLSPVPTGTVNFINTLDGNAVVCTTVTLTAGVATCTVAADAANNQVSNVGNDAQSAFGEIGSLLGML